MIKLKEWRSTCSSCTKKRKKCAKSRSNCCEKTQTTIWIRSKQYGCSFSPTYRPEQEQTRERANYQTTNQPAMNTRPTEWEIFNAISTRSNSLTNRSRCSTWTRSRRSSRSPTWTYRSAIWACVMRPVESRRTLSMSLTVTINDKHQTTVRARSRFVPILILEVDSPPTRCLAPKSRNSNNSPTVPSLIRPWLSSTRVSRSDLLLSSIKRFVSTSFELDSFVSFFLKSRIQNNEKSKKYLGLNLGLIFFSVFYFEYSIKCKYFKFFSHFWNPSFFQDHRLIIQFFKRNLKLCLGILSLLYFSRPCLQRLCSRSQSAKPRAASMRCESRDRRDEFRRSAKRAASCGWIQLVTRSNHIIDWVQLSQH